MEQTGTVRRYEGVPAAVAGRVVELLHPEELVGIARRALEFGDGPTALALQREAEERMAWLSRGAESLRRRE